MSWLMSISHELTPRTSLMSSSWCLGLILWLELVELIFTWHCSCYVVGYVCYARDLSEYFDTCVYIRTCAARRTSLVDNVSFLPYPLGAQSSLYIFVDKV